MTKKKRQKDKERSTKYTHKTKDQVTRTLLKTGSELRCVISSTPRHARVRTHDVSGDLHS
jgi:hypothetical protein